MSTLYVCTPNTVLRASGKLILVTTTSSEGQNGKYQVLKEVRTDIIDTIILFGSIHVTSEAQKLCLRTGVVISYFSRDGRFLGCTESRESKCSDLKIIQYRTYIDDKKRLQFSQYLIWGKLYNEIELLKYFALNNEKVVNEISNAIAQISILQNKIQYCSTIDQLFGIEGAAANAYFNVYGLIFKKDLVFNGRKKHPCTDEVNSLLSFGYTILTNLIAGILASRGLEPAIGFCHDLRSNRPSLALDIIEEFRHVVVDRFVSRTCNLRQFNENMFEQDEETQLVTLKSDYKKLFFNLWERYISNPIPTLGTAPEFRKNLLGLIVAQVDNLVMSLRNQHPYFPFRFES